MRAHKFTTSIHDAKEGAARARKRDSAALFTFTTPARTARTPHAALATPQGRKERKKGQRGSKGRKLERRVRHASSSSSLSFSGSTRRTLAMTHGRSEDGTTHRHCLRAALLGLCCRTWAGPNLVYDSEQAAKMAREYKKGERQAGRMRTEKGERGEEDGREREGTRRRREKEKEKNKEKGPRGEDRVLVVVGCRAVEERGVLPSVQAAIKIVSASARRDKQSAAPPVEAQRSPLEVRRTAREAYAMARPLLRRRRLGQWPPRWLRRRWRAGKAQGTKMKKEHGGEAKILARNDGKVKWTAKDGHRIWRSD
ncbi:hypothetical protein C8J57DRAFT_1225906 [Mycena rebaudengoi]|nr:hypothetical protein C8J57DRAFT_1225906 [Mycena rebaudengoi]